MRKINSNLASFNIDELAETEIVGNKERFLNSKGPTILRAFEDKIVPVMKLRGLRERSIQDYRFEISRFSKVTSAKLISQLNEDNLIKYVSHGEVSQLTRSNRLKRWKAILNYFKRAEVIQENDWWNDLRIKVNETVKEGASQSDINAYLKTIDFSTYVGVRDALALVLMWETGLRIGTVTQLTLTMIDFDNGVIKFPGYTLKNGRNHVAPINARVKSLLKIIIQENKILLDEVNKSSKYIFLTIDGNDCIGMYGRNSALGKSIIKRAKKHGLDKIKAHNLRRGFANNLRAHGVDIATISKVLGHQDLSTTTKYLHVSDEEQIRAINSVYGENWYNQL